MTSMGSPSTYMNQLNVIFIQLWGWSMKCNCSIDSKVLNMMVTAKQQVGFDHHKPHNVFFEGFSYTATTWSSCAILLRHLLFVVQGPWLGCTTWGRSCYYTNLSTTSADYELRPPQVICKLYKAWLGRHCFRIIFESSRGYAFAVLS